jgi:hypothetical protein
VTAVYESRGTPETLVKLRSETEREQAELNNLSPPSEVKRKIFSMSLSYKAMFGET